MKHDAMATSIRTPHGWRLALVPATALAVCGLIAAGSAGSDRADARSVLLASAWVLISSAVAPVAWSLVRSMSLSGFMSLSMGLSMGRVLVFGALAGVFAWLVGVDATSYWVTFFAGAGALLVAEKALAIASAWPLINATGAAGHAATEGSA